MIFFYDLPGWLLLAASLLLFYRLVNVFFSGFSLIYTFYSLSALALILSAGAGTAKLIIGPDFFELASEISEWSRISAVALILCGLTALIREAKPPFARFPRIFSLFPLAIIPAHYYALHAAVLKEWVVGIYEAGSILIGFVMYVSYLRRDINFGYIVSGIVLILFAFISYWFRNQVLIQTENAWKLVFAGGLFFIALGISRTEKHFIPVKSKS